MKFALSVVHVLSTLALAYAPANRPYDVQNYRLSFEMDLRTEIKELRIQTEISGKATQALSKLELDAVGLKIHSVKSLPSGKSLPFDASSPKVLSVQVGDVKKGGRFRFVVDATAPVRSSHDGLFRVTDPDDAGRGHLYFTMFEPEEARTVFPCNDEPYDKATTEVIARVPKDFTVVSNGRKVRDAAVKNKREPWHEIHWQMVKPHSTYPVSFSVGKFSSIAGREGKTEVSLWASRQKIDRAKYALESTRHSLRFFEKYLGTPYMWPKYATIGIPTYLWGGMENTSATHMNQERTLLNDPTSAFEKKRITGLAAHELAHQWFGDYVTMKWWDDLWLNEAFASFMATLAEKEKFQTDEAEIAFVTDLWDDYFKEENGPRSHPIVDKELSGAGDAFDSTNYTKGEAVLRTLRFHVGEDKFRKGLKLYLSKHGFSNANNADFFQAMSQASGEDLSEFRGSWLLKRGYPVVNYDGKWEGTKYTFHIAQRPNHSTDSHLFTFRIPVVFHRTAPPAYEKRVTIEMGKVGDKTLKLDLPAEPEWINVNEGGVVLASVSMTERDENVLARQLLEDTDPFSRVWASYQLFAPLTKDENISTTAEKILLKSLREEKTPYVRIATLQGLQKMKARHLPEILGNGVLELAKLSLDSKYESSPRYKTDPHGETQWRSELIGTLGKVNHADVMPLLVKILTNPSVRLDDLDKGTQAVAMSGSEKALPLLKQTLEIHGGKGYKQRFLVFMAYGSLANPKATSEIAKLSETTTPDVMGRIGWVIGDNQTLKTSEEWASFLGSFVVKNKRFSDEVKARLLHTIEDVKTSPVEEALKTIAEHSESERLKELANKILTKNFS